MAFLIMTICIVFGFVKMDLKGKKLTPLIIVSLFNPLIYFIGETVGIGCTTASESGSFLACIPIVSLLASTFILKKRPNRYQIIGICITLTGVLLTVFAAGLEASFSLTGYIMLLVAVISYALYGVFVEKASEFTGAEITYIMIAAGAAVFGILAITEGFYKGSIKSLLVLPFINFDFLMAILYQGIGCSVMAFFLSNLAIANIGMNRVASFIGISTAVSILAGIVVLKEHFSLCQLAGVVLILAGVYAANIRQNSYN